MGNRQDAYQSCPTTNKAQNMVPCASQYIGHAHLNWQCRGLNFAKEGTAGRYMAIRTKEQQKLAEGQLTHHVLAVYAATARPATIATSLTR